MLNVVPASAPSPLTSQPDPGVSGEVRAAGREVCRQQKSGTLSGAFTKVDSFPGHRCPVPESGHTAAAPGSGAALLPSFSLL